MFYFSYWSAIGTTSFIYLSVDGIQHPALSSSYHLSSTALTVKVMVSGSRDFSC